MMYADDSQVYITVNPDHSNHIETTFQRSLLLQWLESGFLMIAIISAIAELFFFSAIAAITAIVAIIWKPGLSYASLLFLPERKRSVELCKRENKACLQD